MIEASAVMHEPNMRFPRPKNMMKLSERGDREIYVDVSGLLNMRPWQQIAPQQRGRGGGLFSSGDSTLLPLSMLSFVEKSCDI